MIDLVMELIIIAIVFAILWAIIQVIPKPGSLPWLWDVLLLLLWPLAGAHPWALR